MQYRQRIRFGFEFGVVGTAYVFGIFLKGIGQSRFYRHLDLLGEKNLPLASRSNNTIGSRDMGMPQMNLCAFSINIHLLLDTDAKAAWWDKQS